MSGYRRLPLALRASDTPAYIFPPGNPEDPWCPLAILPHDFSVRCFRFHTGTDEGYLLAHSHLGVGQRFGGRVVTFVAYHRPRLGPGGR